MKRLTEYTIPETGFSVVSEEKYKRILMEEKPSVEKVYNRLKKIEDILGDEYDLNRLRELAKADSLIGKTVYEPNKRGFISTYEVISTHISKCSILIGWNLLDGVYSNLNGFEISALGKTVFLTREDAEAALRREQE